MILEAKPSQGDLYPHELAMIFYASIGQVQYANPGFADVFQRRLKVYNPVCLLYSLVDRGYIRRSQFDENIRFYGTRGMQRFVKEHRVKSSSKRDVLAEIIHSNFTESKVHSVFCKATMSSRFMASAAVICPDCHKLARWTCQCIFHQRQDFPA